jgi:hypothetical protein
MQLSLRPSAPRRTISTMSTGRSLRGQLFKYGLGGQHTAFRSGEHGRCLIHVGGLTDGLFACGYVLRNNRLWPDQAAKCSVGV